MNKSQSKNAIWIVVIIVVLLAAGGGFLAINLFNKQEPNPVTNPDQNPVQNPDRNPENKTPPSGNQQRPPKTNFAPAKIKPLDMASVELDPVLKVRVVRDELLVTMQKDVTREQLQRLLKLVDPTAKIVGEIPAINMFQVQLTAATKRGTQQRLENHPQVLAVGLNIVRFASRDFNDPFLNNEKSIDDWGIQKIRAPKAWDNSTGKGTTVAIVDSGTLLTHEEVTGKIEQPWSFANDSEKMMHLKFKNYFSGRMDFVAGHGTHVAITAAGTANNQRGTAGIAPQAKIMPIQVLYFKPVGDQAQGPQGVVTGSAAEIIAGITRAISSEVDVINLSLGRGWDQKTLDKYWKADAATRKQMEETIFVPVRDNDLKSYMPVIDLAQKHNVILVNAAGNDNIPARLDAFCYSKRMISVAATTPQDQRAGFSNYGDHTTVSAPGYEIYSGFSSGPDAYIEMPGTSMASPHVAGLVALMREIKPTITFAEAKQILIKTGVKLKTDQPIGPLVNAAAAVKEVARRVEDKVPPPEQDPPLIDEPQNPETPDDPDSPAKPDPKQPERQPTPEEIVNGPAPWLNEKVQNLIDLWLSIATPPLEPVDGRPWFYDKWARHLNNYNVWANYEPDHGGMTRHQYVWQFAKKLDSTRHGTLYEFVLGMLRDGKFDVAPPSIPGKKPPRDRNPDGKDKPGNKTQPETPNDRPADKNNPGQNKPGQNKPGQNKPGQNKPGQNKPGQNKPPEMLPVTMEQLKGQWAGENGLKNQLGLKFFDDQNAWIIRDGNPQPYVGRLETKNGATKLVLAQKEKDRVVILIEREDESAIKICTYFNTSSPRFRDGDQRYTYKLVKTNAAAGDANIAEYGFKPGSIRLRSTEQVVVGSKDEKLMRGTGYVMEAGAKVIAHEISQNGNIIWFVVDTPASGGQANQRERQVWSMRMDTGKFSRSALNFDGLGRVVIKCSPDGQSVWLLGDTSHKQAVQARREVKIFKASLGAAFNLIADTNSNEEMDSLGLAQSYYPNVTRDGNSILFVDRFSIWKISSGGFQKVIHRDHLGLGDLKPWGSHGFHRLHLASDGSHWIAGILMKRGKQSVHTLLLGDLHGNARVVAESARGFNHLRISAKANQISYFDYADRKTHVGPAGNTKPLETVGRWAAFATEFINEGKQCYAVIGSTNTSSQVGGFIHDLNTGTRQMTHSSQLIGPLPGRMSVNADGRKMCGLGRGNTMTMVDLKPQTAAGPQILEAFYRIEKEKMTIRFKLDQPDDVRAMKVVALHQGFIPSREVLKYEEQPFRSWGGYASMRPSRLDPSYYESTTSSKMDLAAAVEKTTFWVTVQSKNGSRVNNYLVSFAK